MVATICFQLKAMAQIEVKNYDPEIEVHFKNISLYNALEEIGTKSQRTIGYIFEWLKNSKYVTLDTVAPFSVILKRCLDNQPLECRWKMDIDPPMMALLPRALEVTVTDSSGNPLMNVTVKTDLKVSKTDNKGRCIIPKAACDSIVVLTSIDREPVVVKLKGQTKVSVKMALRIANMDATIVSDGYQRIPKESQTGSFSYLPDSIFYQSNSPSILEGMMGRIPGFLFISSPNTLTNEPQIQIRGQSTIYANPNSLIIVDGFPFRGDFRSINPNDVENITILKDAAAASVWGAMSGNGVIVISTKKAKLYKQFKVRLNSNITILPKKDLYYPVQLTTEEFVEFEKLRMDSGYYNTALLSNNTALSEVVETWNDFNNGKISSTTRDARLSRLRTHDKREDLAKYFYNTGLLQQHFLNISGATTRFSYNLSGGFTRLKANEVTTLRNQVTLNVGFGYKLRNLEVSTYNYLSFLDNKNDGHLPTGLFPNSFIVDNGLAAIVPSDIRQSYKDSINQEGIFQDWNWRPYDELKENEFRYKQNSKTFNVAIKYTLRKILYLNIQYQNYIKSDNITDYNSPSSYKARHLQNSYAQNQTGTIVYPIPKGGILNWQNNIQKGENGRFLIRCDLGASKRFRFSGLLGIDFNKTYFDSSSGTHYGYTKDLTQVNRMNYNTYYSMYYDPTQSALIPNQSAIGSHFNYNTAIFANIGITFKGRYHFSSSVRTDESNLFGSDEKSKRIPLGSFGMKWDINEEPIIRIPWLSYINVRGSIGTSGNINNNISSYATAERGPTNTAGQTPLTILTPNNDHIRWERSTMKNLAIEWSDINRVFQFTFEYYWRNSARLVAPSLQDPTLGYSNYWDNTAQLKGKGFDFSLQTNFMVHKLELSTLFWISYNTNSITRFENPQSQARYFTDNRFLSPREGYPVNAVNAFRWAGLDPVNGNPQVYLAGNPSQEYIKINGSSPDSCIINMGSSIPTLYGAFSPTIRYKWISIIATFIGKFKNYFKRASSNYSDPYTNTVAGENDYNKRWRKPGDENHTFVPSLKITQDNDRDNTYANSSALVEKGDNIKLKFLRFDFNISKSISESLGLKGITIFTNIDNVYTLWTATKTKVDADHLTTLLDARTYAAGVNIDF